MSEAIKNRYEFTILFDVETVKEDESGYRIYIKENVPLNTSDAEACAFVGVKSDDKSLKAEKKKDPIRTFGATAILLEVC